MMPAMIRRRSALPCLLAAVLLALAAGSARPGARTGAFDYLVLALSWSPTYCASDDGRGNGSQCAPGRRYAFTVHGLWPQFDKGWPEYCASGERYVPEVLIDGMLDIMPSKRLVIHEWRKHGTCSGLSQEGYFAATRALFAKLRIPARYLAPRAAIETTPETLRADFLKTNAWLSEDMMSVQCGNRRDTARLSELRLCFSRDLKPRPCGDNERHQCAAAALILPPVR
jgi:ribonuclease T2